MTGRASNGRTRDDGPCAIRKKIVVELERSTIPHRVFFALHAGEIRTLLDLGFSMKAAWRRLRKGTPPYRGSYATFHGMPALVATTPAGVTHAPGPFPHLSARSVH